MLCYGLGVLVWQHEIQWRVLGSLQTMLLYFKTELRA